MTRSDRADRLEPTEMRAEGLRPDFGDQDLPDLAASQEAFELAPARVVGGVLEA